LWRDYSKLLVWRQSNAGPPATRCWSRR